LGDAVMATPLLDGLIEAGCEVTLWTTRGVHTLLSEPQRLLALEEMNRSRKLIDTFRASRGLRRRFDIAIVVNRGFRSAALARLAGIRTRVGHDVDRRGWLLTKAIPYDLEQSEVESYLDLGRAVRLTLASRHPSLHATEGERAEARNLLQGATVGLQPGATWVKKRLRVEVLAGLARKLASQGEKVAILGGDDEVAAGNELTEALDVPYVDLVGRTSIREAVGLGVELRAAVGGDTGLMHVLAGAGCKTVTVFATKPTTKWGHLYEPHVVIRAPDEDPSQVELAPLVGALLGSVAVP
ncbi:MAG: glycosyltransferase family 9 protein, partial [Fimbriimonas ginsengisoli]|nr:glycosyltransferase family 9 protein [Fimbriimonas ginsengisoli]